MRALALGLFTLGLLTGPLRAQGAEQRAQIDRWRDSLSRISDTTELASLVRREREERPRAERDLGRLRLGWALIRQGLVTGRSRPLVDATTQFYEASVRHRDWPEAWFGLGAAKVGLDGLGVREVRSAHQSAGNGWRQGAILALVDALRVDPDFREAAIEAAKLTLRDDDVAVRAGLPQAIERAVTLDSTDALGWMLLGRMRRRLGNDQGAADAYGVAVRLGGEVRGIASLELARQLATLGHPDSAGTVYYDGAVAPDTFTAAAYRKDLAAIATLEDLAAWDSLPSAGRAAWLHDFWHRRELNSGRPAGTRLPEHFRRWRLAYRSYRLAPAWTRQYQFGMAYRSGSDELDDRGTIYLRHGEPDTRIIHPKCMTQESIGCEYEEPAETWVYERTDGRLIFHFKLSGFAPPGGSPLATTGANTLAPVSGWRSVESIAYINNVSVLSNLINVDPVYLAMWSGSVGGRESPMWQRERLIVRESIERGGTTDSDPLRFERVLHPVVQAYGVSGGRAGNGQVLLLWYIPATDALIADTVPGIEGVIYSVRARVNVRDSTGRALTEIDTVRRFRSRVPLAGAQGLSGLIILEVPPGRDRVQIALTDSAESQGALRVVENVPVPAFAGGLEMSDLVLGIEGGGHYWETAEHRFPLNPRNAWTPTEAMEIGFELAGLAAGTGYKVRIAVADLGADSTRPPRASVEFENQANGARELVTQRLGLRALRPGVYLLTVTVTAGDRSIKRERRVTIVAPR